jgi:hypothetical protein
MMKAFSDYFTDPGYIHSYAKSESCFGIVYVESEHDIAFWQEIFSQSTDRKYSFKMGTSEQPHARSKTLFSSMYATANETAMIAIDSDFDYLAPNRSEVAQAINRNPFVLQTYVYSVESINLEAQTLDDCLAKTKFVIPHEFTLSRFLGCYSAIIYPVLLRYLYLMDNRLETAVDELTFHQAVTAFDINEVYFKQDWADFNQVIAALSEQLNPLIGADAIQGFTAQAQQKGLSEKNAYQFIKGHLLEERIVQPLVLGIVNTIKVEEMVRIKAAFDSNEIAKRKKEMDKHFEKRCVFDTLVAVCELKKQDPFYQRICEYLSSLLSVTVCD